MLRKGGAVGGRGLTSASLNIVANVARCAAASLLHSPSFRHRSQDYLSSTQSPPPPGRSADTNNEAPQVRTQVTHMRVAISASLSASVVWHSLSLARRRSRSSRSSLSNAVDVEFRLLVRSCAETNASRASCSLRSVRSVCHTRVQCHVVSAPCSAPRVIDVCSLSTVRGIRCRWKPACIRAERVFRGEERRARTHIHRACGDEGRKIPGAYISVASRRGVV